MIFSELNRCWQKPFLLHLPHFNVHLLGDSSRACARENDTLANLHFEIGQFRFHFSLGYNMVVAAFMRTAGDTLANLHVEIGQIRKQIAPVPHFSLGYRYMLAFIDVL